MHSSPWASSFCVHNIGVFKHRKAVSFKSVFVLISCRWIFGSDWKNIISSPRTSDGIFCEESTVRHRGVPRWDGAWGKKQVWRPHVWIQVRPCGSNRTVVEEKTWSIFGTLGWPQWFGACNFVPTLPPPFLFHDKMCSCEIRRALDVEPLLWIKILQLRWWFGHLFRMPNKKVVRHVLLGKLTGKRPRGCQRPRWSDYFYEMKTIHIIEFVHRCCSASEWTSSLHCEWKCSASEWTSSLHW